MNIRDLRYFLAVAEFEHFGQAANKCCVSQPTLSTQIKKLEQALGVQLFERTKRRVLLTECGQKIAVSARLILQEVDAILETAKTHLEPLSGKFKLAAFPTLSTYIFPYLVPKITAAMPGLRLILIEEKTEVLINQLKIGEIDAALLALPIEDDFLACEPVFEDEFLLAVPLNHVLTQQTSKIMLNDLLEYPLLLLDEGHCLRSQALEICKLHGIEEEPDVKATSLETLRLMVKAGTGITFIPKIAANKNETGICYLTLAHPPKRTLGLVWRKTTTRTQVLDHLTNMLKAGSLVSASV